MEVCLLCPFLHNRCGNWGGLVRKSQGNNTAKMVVVALALPFSPTNHPKLTPYRFVIERFVAPLCNLDLHCLSFKGIYHMNVPDLFTFLLYHSTGNSSYYASP